MSGFFPGTIFGTGTTTVNGTGSQDIGQTKTGGGGSWSGGGNFGAGLLQVIGKVISPQMIAAYRNAITGGVGAAVVTTANGAQVHVVGTAGGKLYQVGTPATEPAPGVDPNAAVVSSGIDGTTLLLIAAGVGAAWYFAKRR